jgi:Xaa-Pro aminopeptidase
MNNRLSALVMLLPQNVDAALIISETNRRYFTGFVSSLGYLFVTREKSVLLVDSRYEEAARKTAVDCEVVRFQKLSDSIKEVVTQYRLKNILLEGSAFTLNEAEHIGKMLEDAGAASIKNAELDKYISRLRVIKTSDEIGKMLHAQRLTEEAFTETIKLIKEGVTERELALELEFRMRRAGADGVSFDLIVLAGNKTSMPHGVPGYNPVHNGDFVLFDIGATVDGYHSDMTRTVAFGKVSAMQRRIYQTVLQAQKNGLDAVRQGASCHEVDKAARSYIDEAGYQGMFGHSTGHGVGLDIHESPSVSPDNNYILHSGMVITVEPGIYVPGRCGVRIEDMVAVTRDGCINLATLPKELIEL